MNMLYKDNFQDAKTYPINPIAVNIKNIFCFKLTYKTLDLNLQLKLK